MNKKISFSIVLLLILISVFLSGCKAQSSPSHTTQIFALDTVIDITAYGDNAQQAISAATAEIYRLEKLLSVTDENSEIYKLNNSKGKSVTISEDTYQLLELAKQAAAQTNGIFEPTIYPVLKLWGFTKKEYRVPSDNEITTALTKVNYENIVLNENLTASLKQGAEVDMGAIAKGFIADKAADAMKEAGCSSGLISLGGNVRTIGKKPNGEAWSIGIKYPHTNDYFATIKADECSVITSGAYQRNFTVEGKTYHHIIDPKTGRPAESGTASVTIIGKDGTMCDALSTAIFAGGTEFAETLQRENFEYIILTNDNQVYVSQGLKDKFSLADSSSELNVIYR